jgi:pimeloyl-ACP methyl ester carboxylesterase
LSEHVILLHGMGRTPASMSPLRFWLGRAGYRTHNWGYWSYRLTAAELAEALAARMAAVSEEAERVHFVTHSLGGILMRAALAAAPLPNAGRAVMLVPPNQGSRAADRWSPYLGRIMPPIRDLTTTPASLVHQLPAPELEVGVIAGAMDGKVSVDEARLRGAREQVVLPCRHSFIMHRRDVRDLTLRFLRTGTFEGES